MSRQTAITPITPARSSRTGNGLDGEHGCRLRRPTHSNSRRSPVRARDAAVASSSTPPSDSPSASVTALALEDRRARPRSGRSRRRRPGSAGRGRTARRPCRHGAQQDAVELVAALQRGRDAPVLAGRRQARERRQRRGVARRLGRHARVGRAGSPARPGRRSRGPAAGIGVAAPARSIASVSIPSAITNDAALAGERRHRRAAPRGRWVLDGRATTARST